MLYKKIYLQIRLAAILALHCKKFDFYGNLPYNLL